jgi:hypothetical protein
MNTSNASDTNPLMVFRSCFSEIQVPVTQHLLLTLDKPIPTDNAAFTSFDQLVHSSLMAFGEKSGGGFSQT